MNRSVAVFSAIAVALLVGLIGLRRVAPDPARGAGAVAGAAAPSAVPPSAVAAAVPQSGEPRSGEPPFAFAASSLPVAVDEPRSTPLGIPAEHLAEARRQVAELAGNLDGFRATLNDARYHNQSLNSGQPAKKLALRLGLDAEAGAAVEAVFAAALSEQIERRINAERDRLDREARLLAEDRDGYVSYLALETMLARGATLSLEQTAFHRTFGEALAPSETSSGASAASPGGVAAGTSVWYEDPTLLAELGARLSPEQNAELSVYVDEQKGRDQEVRSLHARMRANRIAEQLGLSAADQGVLLDYLVESPGATSGEIAALLPAELRELLPAGL